MSFDQEESSRYGSHNFFAKPNMKFQGGVVSSFQRIYKNFIGVFFHQIDLEREIPLKFSKTNLKN